MELHRGLRLQHTHTTVAFTMHRFINRPVKMNMHIYIYIYICVYFSCHEKKILIWTEEDGGWVKLNEVNKQDNGVPGRDNPSQAASTGQ